MRQRLARYHDDPDSAFHGWNDVWLDPAFRTGMVYLSLWIMPIPDFDLSDTTEAERIALAIERRYRDMANGRYPTVQVNQTRAAGANPHVHC